MVLLLISVYILFMCQHANGKNLDDYKTKRLFLQQKEMELQVGGNLHLNSDEVIANDILMRLKRKEINDSFQHNKFKFSKHYFSYKSHIKNSKVYQIIRSMPKGAALHVHSSLMLSAESLVSLTYEDYLFACMSNDDMKLQFSFDAPQRPCPHKWQLLNEIRKAEDNVTQFDIRIRKYFTLDSDEKKDRRYDINTIWKRFEGVYQRIVPLLSYRPVREKFFYKALEEFYEDNIMYIEIRSGLSYLYELNGTVHDRLYMAHLYNSVAQRFKETHPDFIGVKIIVTRQRSTNMQGIKEVIENARRLKEELPDFFAGFDLVGQEDLGKPLIEFQPILEEVRNDINFYFHGGETNWYGTTSDENLIDAILLGSKRIGHGYALIKHPTLLNVIKEKDIAIEVNVISNLVLSLLCDVRNHPLASYLALGMPVVLSSDDPGIWGADPISHDYYIAFVGVASKHADIRMLKQLVINSIKYSALNDQEKDTALKKLKEKWDVFITNIIRTHRQ